MHISSVAEVQLLESSFSKLKASQKESVQRLLSGFPQSTQRTHTFHDLCHREALPTIGIGF